MTDHAPASTPPADIRQRALIPPDRVRDNMAPLIEEGIITSADASLVVWYATLLRSENITVTDAAKRIGYSASTLSRLLQGNYGGDYTKVIEAVRQYRHLASERAKMASDEFVETSVWERVRSTCDLALLNGMPAVIMGPSQIGKTTALLEYKRRSEYNVVYVRMPAAPSHSAAVYAIAEAFGLSSKMRVSELLPKILRIADARTLLIIDEVHQVAISAGRSALRIMETIRQIRDESDCGLVICGTRAVDHELINSPALKGWLEQFVERCIRRLELPNDLPEADILATVAAYGMPAPDPDAARLIRTMRMNRLTKLIGLARKLASKNDDHVTWDHFRAAYRLVNN